MVAGPYHPAFRQLVEGRLWYDAIVQEIKKINDAGENSPASIY